MIQRLLLLLFAMTFLPVSSQVGADDAAGFYKDKTISFVIGARPGGGFDTYARMLAPHLARVTGSEVIVVNRPGGGGHVAINQLVNEKPDGLTVMLAHGTSAVLGVLSDREGIRYDLRDFSYIGRVAAHNRAWLIASTSEETPASIAAGGKPIVFSSTAKIDGFSDSATVACYALDLDCKIVTGYKAKEAVLAVINGEATSIIMSDSSSTPHTNGGEVKAIAVLGSERSSLFPDVATLLEQVDVPEERQWVVHVHEDIREVGRMLIAPPGVPEDRVAFLREAFKQVLTDPAVIEEGAAIRRHISYADAEATRQLVVDILDEVSGDRLADFKTVFVDSYY